MGAQMFGIFVSSPLQIGAETGVGYGTSTFFDGALFPAASTRYIAGYGGYYAAVATADTVTGGGRKICGVNGKLRKFLVKCATNATTGDSTLKFRIGGVNQHTLTIPAGSTAFLEASNLDITVADTDEIGFQLINGGGGAIGTVSIFHLIQPTDVS